MYQEMDMRRLSDLPVKEIFEDAANFMLPNMYGHLKLKYSETSEYGVFEIKLSDTEGIEDPIILSQPDNGGEGRRDALRVMFLSTIFNRAIFGRENERR